MNASITIKTRAQQINFQAQQFTVRESAKGAVLVAYQDAPTRRVLDEALEGLGIEPTEDVEALKALHRGQIERLMREIEDLRGKLRRASEPR